jgi:alkylresorcinol/alkylpyrone synthase
VVATIAGCGWSAPPSYTQQSLWDDFFRDHYAGNRLAEAVWRRVGVTTRHGVVDPRVEDISQWTTGQRMRRFLPEALPLGKEALTACMADAGLQAADVDALTVVSCTGYATPGLDVLLARDLGLPAAAQRLHIGHMGCYAAIPALATAADAAAARDKTTLLLCLELTSLHVQPGVGHATAEADPQQMVAHALFSDAAAAVALTPGRGRLEVIDVVARTDVSNAPLMTWDVTDLGFRMGLSPQVPDALAPYVVEAVEQLCRPHGVRRQQVARWAVHPGGPRIVDVVAEQLELDDAQVADSRAVLAEHGNCSSATVLLILDRILAAGDLEPGDHVVAMAFGPGLTLYATLLRVTA